MTGDGHRLCFLSTVDKEYPHTLRISYFRTNRRKYPHRYPGRRKWLEAAGTHRIALVAILYGHKAV